MDHTRELFLTFYEEYYEHIHRHIYYRTGCNQAIADDLTAEVFMKALENLSRFDARSSLKTWIYRIANNHVIDYYRTRKTTVSLDDAVEIAGHTNFTEEVASKMDTEQVLTALNRLSPQHQEILTLKYVDQLDTTEIAEVMKIPASRVYVTIHRALNKLRTHVPAQS